MPENDGGAPELGVRRRRLITAAIAAAAVLLLAGGVGAFAYSSATAREAPIDAADSQDASRDAAITDAVQARSDAYDLVVESRAAATAAGSLLSDRERQRLLDGIGPLEELIEAPLSREWDAADLREHAGKFGALIDEALDVLRDAATAATKRAEDRLATAPLASPTSRAAVANAVDALEAGEPSAALLGALLAAVVAAENSHADAASATGSGGTGGGSGGGAVQPPSDGGGSGGGGSSGPSTPPAPPPPPPPPPYTDSDARAAVLAAYGDAQLGAGAGCYLVNSGTWGRNSVPPAPRRDKIAEGGWLGFTAESTGAGGQVQYFACY